MYKYFCGECGHKFESDMPELDKNGLHNDIPCPACGSWNIYVDTEEGAARSVEDLTDYENSISGWNEEE